MKGIVVLAHGSRSEEALAIFRKVLAMTEEKLGQKVHGAYMESSQPDLKSTIDDLVAQGIDDILVMPYFLFQGIHLKEDIPRIMEECRQSHPGIKMQLGKILGADSRLADILVDRIRE